MCANWRQTAWEMDTSEIDTLFTNLQRTSSTVEKTINDVLKKSGSSRVMASIQPNIPVSMRKKKHARTNRPLTAVHSHFQFKVRPKRKFEYIKYPDLAIGRSQYREPAMFMKQGLDEATPEVVNDIIQAVITDIQNTIGGD